MSITNPIVNQQRLFTIWSRKDVYTGPNGTGQYVPNPEDMVFDRASGWWYVQDVDYTTNLCTLIAWRAPDNEVGVIAEDVLLGAGPGSQSESYRAYLDTSVVPHVMALDARLHIYGSNASFVKVFRGTDISGQGVVISAMVDQAGNVTSENIPLETVQTPQQNTSAIKTTAQAYSVETLADGEVVTAVVYSEAGAVLSYAKLLVKRTNFIRTTDASRKYITSIELVSDRLSPTDNKLLEYPINMLVQSGALRGKVNYSDGDSAIMQIDGTRFELQGLNRYIASVVGQRIPLMLVYHFADNEYGYDVSGVSTDRFMAEDYEITTTDLVGAYSVKLFAAPRWVSSGAGYTLDFYLYNLARDEVYNVTPYVELVQATPFNPFPTGATQNITARIELSTIGASYGYYVHTQTFRIALLTAGSSSSANWWIEYSPGGDQIGGSNAAVVTNTGLGLYSVDISIGKATSTEWLNAVFYAAEPLFHPVAESEAPQPNYLRVKIGNTFVREIALADWQSTLDNVPLTSPDPKQGDVVRLEFIKRVGSDDLELGLGVLPIHTVIPV